MAEVRNRLSYTAEGDLLLYKYGVGKVEYFEDVEDLLVRASKGSALSCGELLAVNCLLRSARTAYRAINAADSDIVLLKKLVQNVYFDENLESDIAEKILANDKVSDYASDTLYAIRSKIKSLNER
ncbi:MAG: hypothetical protein ACI4QN_00190, partial [Candidatus Coproplasma sp.]